MGSAVVEHSADPARSSRHRNSLAPRYPPRRVDHATATRATPGRQRRPGAPRPRAPASAASQAGAPHSENRASCDSSSDESGAAHGVSQGACRPRRATRGLDARPRARRGADAAKIPDPRASQTVPRPVRSRCDGAEGARKAWRRRRCGTSPHDLRRMRRARPWRACRPREERRVAAAGAVLALVSCGPRSRSARRQSRSSSMVARRAVSRRGAESEAF